MANERSLEMRIAAIEDKLANLNISEEDLKVYNRVAAQLAGRGGGGATCVAAQPAIVCYCFCHIFNCTIINPIYNPIYNPNCVNDCIPFAPGALGAQGIGAQFRTLGKQQEGD